MQTHFDIIIIWAWAAGLFTSVESSASLSKLILEKNKNPWVKVLLSGW
jgi:predicted flavoprotein YhiN